MRRSTCLAAAIILLLGCASRRPPESVRALPTTPPAPQATAETGRLGAEQLDELVARVALYPDELLALVLPSSTQPIQIVEAARFLEARKNDPQLAPQERWDEPVKSLLNYPEVVQLMNDDLSWTQALGDAVTNQQADVMEAIQQVRTRALAAGNLKTGEQHVVTQEGKVIRIESADPKVVYVPIYDPTVIYVASPTTIVTYYPPYPCYWCPGAYGMGMMMGFNWYYYDIYYDHDHHHHDDIDIDIDIERPERPDRPERPSRPEQVWKPKRPGSGQGAVNRPAGRPSTLPSQPGVAGTRPASVGPTQPISMDRLTKLPPASKLPSAGSQPGYQTPSTRESYGGYERGRDAMRESDRGARSRGANPSYGDRSTRGGSSWGGYGNSADAWSSRGAASRSGMPGSGGGGGFGGGGGRGGGGRGR